MKNTEESLLALTRLLGSQVVTKPHGHGDVHRLLYTSGTIHRLEEQGYRWLYFFQDTNALAIKVSMPHEPGKKPRRAQSKKTYRHLKMTY